MSLLDLPTWMHAAFLGVWGLLFGSFANVLIHRLPQEEPEDRNVVTKGSHCPQCKTPIKPWHNVPLFGWLWLRGKCAACGWRIPFRYPLVEGLTGLVFAASAYAFPVGSLIWFKGLLCGYALVILFFTDLSAFFLPDAIQFPLIVVGLLFTVPQLIWPGAAIRTPGPEGAWLRTELWHNGLQPGPLWTVFRPAVDWLDAFLGAALGYGLPAAMNWIYAKLRHRDGIGMGDFKMLAWLGAFWGWGAMLGIFFLAAFLAILLGLPLAALAMVGEQRRVVRILRYLGLPTEGSLCARMRTRLMTRMLPFGCFLALATFPIVFFGVAWWQAYLSAGGLR
jgi:prepilin signal peptidase PulO-like enzyme (type II secretory pathway)